jgi:hypothetical protein
MMIAAINGRIATQERWQAALRRAFDEGLQARVVERFGVVVVTSGSQSRISYATNGFDCTCLAGEYEDPICKHRALYWHECGVLDLAPELGEEPVSARCLRCHSPLANDELFSDGHCANCAAVTQERDEIPDVLIRVGRIAPAGLVVFERCRECRGTGVRYINQGGGLSDFITIECSECSGTGSVAIGRGVRPAGLPAPVAAGAERMAKPRRRVVRKDDYPTLDELANLATVARGKGFRIDGQSVIEPSGVAHYQTMLTCDCPRFARTGACQHHAFFLESYVADTLPVLEGEFEPLAA